LNHYTFSHIYRSTLFHLVRPPLQLIQLRQRIPMQYHLMFTTLIRSLLKLMGILVGKAWRVILKTQIRPEMVRHGLTILVSSLFSIWILRQKEIMSMLVNAVIEVSVIQSLVSVNVLKVILLMIVVSRIFWLLKLLSKSRESDIVQFNLMTVSGKFLSLSTN